MKDTTRKQYIAKTITWRFMSTGVFVLVDEATNEAVTASMLTK